LIAAGPRSERQCDQAMGFSASLVGWSTGNHRLEPCRRTSKGQRQKSTAHRDEITGHEIAVFHACLGRRVLRA